MFGSLKILENNEKVLPLKFYEAVLFQFVNPKASIICLTAVALFFPYKENYPSATSLSLPLEITQSQHPLNISATGSIILTQITMSM